MPRAGLDTERVVDAASEIADAEGLDAVTLARVAGGLGVRAPSLYNHVDGRAGLLRALALRGVRELTAALRDAAVGRSGADALAATARAGPAPLAARARACRAYAGAHPGLYAASGAAPAPDDAEPQAAAAQTVDVVY